MFLIRSAISRLPSACARRRTIRLISTLPNNPNIYVIPTVNGHILSLLPTDPPTCELSLGTATALPPTPATFTENRGFLHILQSVLRKHVRSDPAVIASAGTYASPSGSSIFGARARRGSANAQDRTGSNVGGYVHVFDSRNPPAYGRIPNPEDIFGSVVVDGEGNIQNEGYEECSAYRIITNEGVLGLSDYLREKLVDKLKEEERMLRAHS